MWAGHGDLPFVVDSLPGGVDLKSHCFVGFFRFDGEANGGGHV